MTPIIQEPLNSAHGPTGFVEHLSHRRGIKDKYLWAFPVCMQISRASSIDMSGRGGGGGEWLQAGRGAFGVLEGPGCIVYFPSLLSA